MDRIRKTFSTRSPTEELSRSQYSLVSTDVTEEAVQLWLELPDEVTPYRDIYANRSVDTRFSIFTNLAYSVLTKDEKRGNTNNTILTQRLPSANSAPHLNCNGQKDDVSFFNGQSEVQGGNEKFGINDSDDSPTSKTKSKISQIRQTIKVSLLVGVWIFFTAVFLMHNEKEEVTMHFSVAPAQIKDYRIQNDRNKHSVLVKLTGPFLSEAYEKKMNISDKQNMSRMDIWLEKWVPKGPSKDPGESFDYETVEIPIIYAVHYQVINRTMAAVLLSTSSLAALSIAGERPSVPEIISWLDVETLLLLFSMMVLVAILAETGVFDYYAVLTFQLARGKIWPLITMLCGVTSIVSLLLDNVTTVLLITPVTIR
ncbi:hypothetical protein HF086_014758 [Spodoptera exigua]|uniref:Citrate transporter-like domain-containing protein n=1 Tax=Spodoptera exigua TaxID=7107 RepID=A0A922SHQ4_SPOEX|nr:hypothetical protein HF086_014758 [Spodoptera exigua]